ncbi:hypothetical protein BE20_25015 [Sorangium cellulosum]|uniref:RepB-like DNA primase domain-containing protein n=1 Tax=Sorangium cellulosum TaxID=56 RepID=A0A150SA31_SORCE|nr:hypothetical protein BE20_25015 [Sorangium cellulosum]KYF89257.1 hypothetical protein BE18_22755 [Sorangium cellulosum]
MSEENRSTTSTTVNQVNTPLIAWSRNKYVSADAESLWTGEAHGIGYCVEPLESALATTYTDDAHFVTYVVSNRRWQPRLKKTDEAALREHGIEIRHYVLVADVDMPNHQGITQEAIEDAKEKLAQLPSIGWYTSRGGLRILQPLSRPISPAHYEHAIGLWLPQLQAALGDAWVVDLACKDWTRHFRLPRVIRDGAPASPKIDLSRMRPVDPCAPPPPRPPRAVEDRPRPTLTSDRARILERARKYVGQIEHPQCGTGSCDAAVWNVSVHLRGFGLDEDDALELLTEWALGLGANCEHRRPDRLRRKIEDASRASTVEAGFHLKDDRPARAETTDEGPGFSVSELDEEEEIAALLSGPSDSRNKADNNSGDEDDTGGGKKGGLTSIIGRLRFFRILTGRVFTVISGEAVPIDSERYIEWISAAALRTLKSVVTRDKIKNATTAVVGPRNRLPLGDAPIRYAYDPKDLTIWIDLADPQGRTVHVTPSGSTVCAKGECPIAWYRPDGTAPMPVPVIPASDDGCQAQWAEFWDLQQKEDQTERVASFAWLMAAARPMVQPQTGTLTRYPVGAMTGEHGAGKTSAMEILRTIVDRREPASVKLPRQEKIDDMTIHAEQVAVLAYDNASHLSAEHSDHLCRIATGSGDVKRSLYCDRDLAVFRGSRPAIINGITDFVTRDDLLDRSVLIRQTKPKVRKLDSVLAREWSRIYPRVLGALVYCMATSLARAEETIVDPAIRMLEAAQWAAASEQTAGFEEGAVSRCYMATREHATDMAAEDTFVEALLEIVPRGSSVTDTGAGILRRILEAWEKEHPRTKAPDEWPRTPRGLRAALDRRKSALEALGLTISYASGQRTETSSSARTITLSREAGPKSGLYLAVDNTRTPAEIASELLESV